MSVYYNMGCDERVLCSGVVQNVAADEKPQMTAAAVTDSQPATYSTVSSSTAALDDVMNDSSVLSVAACAHPAETSEPEPVDADCGQNCSGGGTFMMDLWLFLLVSVCLV